MAKVKVKVNPIYPADSIGDEVSGLTFTKDEWTEVRIPLDQLVATSFGRVVRGLSLNPAEVSSIGILLGDKKPGQFQIAIRSISVIGDDN